MKKKLLLPILILIVVSLSNAQINTAVFLDSTFAHQGATPGKLAVTPNMGGVRDMEVDAQGNIIAAVCSTYNNQVYISKFRSDGFRVVPFGPDTMVVISHTSYIEVNDIQLQPDGKILIAGLRTDTSQKMMVVRLTADGKFDNTFSGDGIWIKDVTTANDAVRKIALQSDGKIIVSGVSAASMLTVLRLNSDGSEDLTFNGTGIYTTGFTSEIPQGMALYNDTIFVGGSYSPTAPARIVMVKLLPNGIPDTRMGTAGRLVTPVSYGQTVGPFLHPAGRIVFGGGDSYSRIDLIVFDTFGNELNVNNYTIGPGTYPTPSFFTYKKDKIYFGGAGGGGGHTILKINLNGSIDNTFGIGGKLQISGSYGTVYSGAVAHDGKLLLGTQDGSVPYIYKIQSKSVLHIIGKEVVLPNTAESYTLQAPSGLSLNYSWTYVGMNAALFNPTNTSKVTIFFSDSASNGQLVCTTTGPSGAPYDIVRLDVKVNKKPTAAYQLTKVQCPLQLTDCNTGYIDNFKLNLIDNQLSGCSKNGYTDYTRSELVDTLILGSAYSAKVTVEGSTFVRHVAIWIDYNNDGIFTDDDFAGEGYSDNSEVLVNNIILKNREGFDGPRRLRVRSRNFDGFKPGEACATAGEQGEIEDYLVVIVRQTVLAAPQIITPNDDGKNDYFVVRGIDPSSDNKLTVFDRWGEVKFTTNNYENNWKGTTNDGEKLVQGTYYFVFTNDDEFVKGFLEIRY